VLVCSKFGVRAIDGVGAAVLTQSRHWRRSTLLNLYKILFHLFKDLLWESIILLLPPSTCKACSIAILLHDHCATYTPPTDPPLYAIHHTITILVMAISCKGQYVTLPLQVQDVHDVRTFLLLCVIPPPVDIWLQPGSCAQYE